MSRTEIRCHVLEVLVKVLARVHVVDDTGSKIEETVGGCVNCTLREKMLLSRIPRPS